MSDQTEQNGNALYEDKFARVFSEIRRLDQLRDTEDDARHELDKERTLRLDQRMNGQETAVAAALAAAEKAVTAALIAADKAVIKAETAQAKVNETQNEFRGTLRDQAEKFMPRAEAENLVRELRGLIGNQGTIITELRSRIDVGPPSLSTLQSRSDESVGHKGGTSEAQRLGFALIAAAVTIGSFVYAIVK